jgi:type I site-specific restriction endonuclease
MKTEQQTRIELIDAALDDAGWNVSDPTQVVQEYDIVVNPSRIAEPETPYGGHQFSDYVLLGRDRKPLAVVEAKKTSKDAALGREQAKQYCYNIRKDNGSELPLSVHIVARHADLIKQAQHARYWSACSDAALDELAEKLAPLMKFREQQNPGQGVRQTQCLPKPPDCQSTVAVQLYRKNGHRHRAHSCGIGKGELPQDRYLL